MKVNLIEPIGYCNGVEKTITTILDNSNRSFLLGPPIHNEDLTNRLISEGYTIIGINDIENLSGKTIITSAHGFKKETHEAIIKNNIHIDTTCSIIKNIYNLIEENKDKKILYLGDNNHQEVISTKSHYPNIIVVNSKKDIDALDKTDEYIIICQSTYNEIKFNTLTEYISKRLNVKEIFNTICPFVKKRFANTYDLQANLIIVIGDKNSSNANKIFELAKENNPSSQVLFITNLLELKQYDLSDYEECSILSATSTPFFIIDEISKYLNNY